MSIKLIKEEKKICNIFCNVCLFLPVLTKSHQV